MSLKVLVKIADEMDQGGADAKAINALDMAIQESAGDVGLAMKAVTTFANILDEDGQHATADALDTFIVTAAKEPDIISEMLKPEVIVPERGALNGGGAPLSSRTSPDHPGVMMLRVSDGVYQDMMTKKIYDFNKGWIDASGEKHPGGTIANQNSLYNDYVARPQIFESRRSTTRNR